MKSRHIYFATDRFRPHRGGAAEHAYGLAAECSLAGFDCSVVTFEPASSRESEEERDGLTVRRYPETDIRNRVVRKLYRHLVKHPSAVNSILRLQSQLARRCSRSIVDALCSSAHNIIVCVNVHGTIGYYCGLAKLLSSCKLIIVPCLHPHKAGGILASERLCLQQADHLIANTEYERHILIEQGAEPRRVSVLGPGVSRVDASPAAGDSFRQKYSLANLPVITYLGRFDRTKGIELVIAAFGRLHQSCPEALLLLAGAAGDYDPRTAPSWDESCCRVLFDITDVQKEGLLNACDVLVLASECESYGIVLAEAWMRGKPVIVTASGALTEVVRHNWDGLVVPRTPSALSNGMREMLENLGARQTMGANGRANVLATRTWQHIGSKFVSICEGA